VTRKVLVGLFCIVSSGLMSHGFILMAQNTMTAPGKYVPKAQTMKGLDESKDPLGIVAGQSSEIVPGVVVRRRLEGPNNASIHSTSTDGQDVTEIVEIIDGSGTFMTGGTWVDKTEPLKNKDRTKGIVGGESHEVKAGDFIVLPPGTAHWFSKVNGHVTMVEIRYPGDVTKAKK
jgi:hypothetical protein